MLKTSKLFLLFIFVITTITIVFIYKQYIEEKPKVAIVLKALDREYWNIIEKGAEKGFKDFGIDGKVLGPKDGTAEEQADLLEIVLNENPDVLVVSPINSPTINLILEKFVKKNIPVLLIDTDNHFKYKTAFIGTNNKELGKQAGVLLSTQLQPGNKVALIGRNEVSDVERIKEAKNSLETVGINVVSEKILTSDKVDEKEIQKLIQEHPDLKGVIASNDFIAIQLLKVIKKQQLRIPIIGSDGTTEMIKLIEKGILTGTVSQNPYDIGYLSVDVASRVSKGEKVNRNIDTGVDIITEGNAYQRLTFLKNVLR
jgi:ribose transport system substrate-binding protein